MPNEIRYFSMFTGVGGFELGLKRANDLSKGEGVQQGRHEEDSSSFKQELLASEQSFSRKKANDNSTCRKSEQNEDTRHKSNIKEVEPFRQCATFTCVGMSEFDKYSSQVLARRFPDIKNWGDCTKIDPTRLPDFDLLCGGFPCQAFSIAGKRRGFQDIRGTMFFEVARILKVKRPKIVLLENVKGLLNHNKGETFRVILQTLDELGYEVQWMVLNSKFFGVPQNRERVFIIGNLRGTGRSEILPFNENEQETIGEGAVTRTFTAGGHSGGLHSDSTGIIVKGYLNEDGWDKRNESIRRVYDTSGCCPTIPTGQGGGVMPKIRAVLTPDRPEKRQNGRRFKENGESSFTITGQDIHGVTDGIKIRRLTPVECCRLQGFPDDWNELGAIDDNGVIELKMMSDTQRYKQMGNAVTVNVIAAIGIKILENNNGMC